MRGNAHYGLLVGYEQRSARIPITRRSSLALYEADARGLDEHLADGGVVGVEEPNHGPVAVVRYHRLWLQQRFAAEVESSRAVSYDGEALALLEDVDQTRLR